MSSPDLQPHTAWQRAEHTLGQLLVLFGASVLIVFVLQIPPSQAAQGSGNKMCDGAASQYKCPWPKKAKECEKMKKGKKDGRMNKPCKETCGASGGIAHGECIAPQKCLTLTTCQGKAPKKAEPKKEGGEKKEDGKPPEMPKLPEPPKKEPKEKKEEQPCPANPQLKQGTPECEQATQSKGSPDSLWKKLMDLAR